MLLFLDTSALLRALELLRPSLSELLQPGIACVLRRPKPNGPVGPSACAFSLMTGDAGKGLCKMRSMCCKPSALDAILGGNPMPGTFLLP
jgi:hypothetical protein